LLHFAKISSGNRNRQAMQSKQKSELPPGAGYAPKQ
jgi:hypothetical protein